MRKREYGEISLDGEEGNQAQVSNGSLVGFRC